MKLVKTYVGDTVVVELDMEGGVVTFTPGGVCVENAAGEVVAKAQWDPSKMEIFARGIYDCMEARAQREEAANGDV